MSRKFAALFAVAGILACLPVMGNWAVYKRLETRLDLKIQGQFVPSFFSPSFVLKNAGFEWRDKLRFEKGDLHVQYFPFSFFSARGLRVRLTGKKLEIVLLGEWSQMQGVEKAGLDHFEADFSLGIKGLNEIYCVHVESSAFQFHLNQSENNSTAGSQGVKS